MNALFLIGRGVFGGFFLYSGINHFINRKKLREHAVSKGILVADAAVCISGAVLAAGGFSVAFGVKPKFGALGIAGFLGVVSPTIHGFWAIPDPEQKEAEMVNFNKNMALLGASLTLAARE